MGPHTIHADVRLSTPRLQLRPMVTADASALLAIFSDAETSRYLSRPAWTSIDQAHERLAVYAEGHASGSALSLGIVRLADDVLIGSCSLFKVDWPCRRAEIGYALARPACGGGYMNEALVALLDHGFGAMNLNRVEADIDPRNAASQRTLERLGFVPEGYLRERWIVGDEVSDTALFGLLAREWRARPAPAA
jgi:RimJ/RimL family protein N-acetyltransferase